MNHLLHQTVLTAGLLLAASASSRGEGAEGWEVEAAASRDAFLVYEPVLYRVTYSNISNVVAPLPARGPLPLSSGAETIFRVLSPQEEWQIYMPSQYGRYAIGSMDYGNVMIQLGDSVEREEWLSVGMPGAWELVDERHVVSEGVTLMFPEPGRWAIELVGLPQTRVRFEVVEPAGDEVAASRLFNGAGASAFVSGYGGENREEELTQPMRRLLREYPESAYAPFAAIILGRHEFRVEDERPLRPQPDALREILSPIFEHHRDHPLHAEAMYLMWEATRWSPERDQKQRARGLAVELLEQHPYSSWSDKVRAAYGNAADLPPRPETPPPATTQPSTTQPAVD